MYTFAIIALLALASVKLVDALADYVPGLEPLRSLLTFAVAIGAVWLLDFSLFAGFETPVRNEALGIWVTGFVVAGMTSAWRAVFGYLTHDQATRDETLGEHGGLKRVA